MSKTQAAPDMDALPPAGGSYTRLPDGSLVRTEEDIERTAQQADPTVTKSDVQE